MTGRKSGWGLVNDNPNEVDLSEWGGVASSCVYKIILLTTY